MPSIIKKRTKFHKYGLKFYYNWETVKKVKEITEEIEDWKDFNFVAEEKLWVFSKPYILEKIKEKIKDVEIDLKVIKQIEKEKEEAEIIKKREAKLKQTLTLDDLNEVEVPTKLPLFGFQKKTVDFAERVGGRALLALDMGCLSGDTIVQINRGGNCRKYRLEDAFKRFNGFENNRKNWKLDSYIRSFNEKTKLFELNKIDRIIKKGIKEVHEIEARTVDGIVYKVKATNDHEFLTSDFKWRELGSLKEGQKIMVNGKLIDKDGYVRVMTAGVRNHPRWTTGGLMEHILVMEASLNNLTYEKWLNKILSGKIENELIIDKSKSVHHINGDRSDNRLGNLKLMTVSEHHKLHGYKNRVNIKDCFVPQEAIISKISYKGEEEVYDIVMRDPHRNFIANGMVVHNCGKTICSVGYACKKQYANVLIIAPASLKENWRRECVKFADINPNIIEQTKEIKDGWNIIGYPNIVKYYKQLRKEYDLIILDECFPYDTRVFTNKGYKKIGDIVDNNLDVSVLSCNSLNNELEYKKVIGKRAVRFKQLIKVKHNEGYFLCTPEHKIFTEEGYKKAETLKSGDKLRILRKDVLDSEEREDNGEILFEKLLSEEDKQRSESSICFEKEKEKKNKNLLQMVQKGVFSFTPSQKKSFLFYEMFSYLQDFSRGLEKVTFKKNERESRLLERERKARSILKNERKKSNEEIRSERETFNYIKKNTTQTAIKRWEWSRNAIASKKVIKRIIEIKRWLEGRICYKNERGNQYLRENAESLQNRLSKRRGKDSGRGRRLFPRVFKKKKTGQKERLFFETVRVEGIEIQKQRDLRQFKKCGKEYLYDIEVEDNHNYFAEDVLVSNCHFIKNKKAQRTKKSLLLLKGAKDALFLTGTPILNRPAEIYTVFNFIRPMPFWGLDGFALKYCGAKQTDFGWDINGATNLDDLKEKMSFMIRLKKEDVIDELPDKTINVVETPMDNRVAYNRILDDFRGYLKENNLNENAVFAEALTKINYLKQEVVNQKLKSINEQIDMFLANDQKIIIFSQYRDVVDYLHFRYKNSVKFTGTSTDEERQEAVDKFQNDPDVKLFISTIKAGGVGLTLTEANTVVFTDLSWTPADHEQAEDRAYRIGQKNNVNVYYMMDSSTIENDIWRMLKRKERMVNQIMEGKDKVRKVHIKSLLKRL